MKAALVVLACVLFVLAGFLAGPAVGRLLHPQPTATPSTPEERAGAARALGLLDSVTVRPRTHVAGYDRSCSPGHACVFGPAWSDDTSAPGGHNGCDTRNDVLSAQLRDVDKGTSRCVVRAGTLVDPYSGTTVTFRKAQASEVQIDHVVPLAYAWAMGASAWPLDKRMAFANDEAVNLLAVTKATNQAKGDQGPATWTPSNISYRCDYAIRWVDVLTTYGLAVTSSDRTALRDTLTVCAR
ncbi:MAG: HNH endonuclease family protein [Propionibacteriaceae bacterium]